MAASRGAAVSPLVSIIVPSFNPGNKLAKCLNSLRRLELPPSSYEIVFVDDVSTDGSREWLAEACSERENWNLFSSEFNSGSPSRPRNIGVENACGTFVFFLDCDDEIIGENLQPQIELGLSTSADIVRSPLLVDSGSSVTEVNAVPGFTSATSRAEKIRLLVTHQSTTNSSLIRRDFLIRNNLLWPESNHMGEDTIFLMDVLERAAIIEYFEKPTIVYHKSVGSVRSSTQKYGSRELLSHLAVWDHAENCLNKIGISFMAVRGEIALGYALKMLVKFGTGNIGEGEFLEFSSFVRRHWNSISKFTFAERLVSIINALNAGDFATFEREIRPRLLIAGYDLKFIRSAFPFFEQFYQIRVDEWTGHESHDERQSSKLLEWADIVFCEWLLGNAVWYSKHKRRDQVLIVRMHRFETSRNYGNEVLEASVDAFITVSVETLEDMIRTFRFDRRKCRVVPNYLQVENYRSADDPGRIFKLALVGAIPARKGLHSALQLLRELRIFDERYTLTLFGKRVDELPWVAKDPIEQKYFADCARYVSDYRLEEAVSHGGWVSPEDVIQDYGFVLSTSEAESFHVAPAEGFVSGNQGLFLSWPGVEYIYPRDYIFDDVQDMREYVLRNREVSVFETNGKRGKDHVVNRYSMDSFVSRIRDLALEV